MGQTSLAGDGEGVFAPEGEACSGGLPVILGGEGENRNVYGTYIHGIFDRGETAAALVKALAAKKHVEPEIGGLTDYQHFKEQQYEKIAYILRKYVNMEKIYELFREARTK